MAERWCGRCGTRMTVPDGELAAAVVVFPCPQCAMKDWRGQPAEVTPVTYQGPARTAHGPAYWLLVGWWWLPLAKLGRVLLWMLFWPAGLWRSMRHGRKTRESRERRGYR